MSQPCHNGSTVEVTVTAWILAWPALAAGSAKLGEAPTVRIKNVRSSNKNRIKLVSR